MILFIKHGFTPIGTGPYAYTSRFYHTAKGPIDGLKNSTSGRVWYSKSRMISTWFSLGVGNSTFGNEKPSRIFSGQNSHFQGGPLLPSDWKIFTIGVLGSITKTEPDTHREFENHHLQLKNPRKLKTKTQGKFSIIKYFCVAKRAQMAKMADLRDLVH